MVLRLPYSQSNLTGFTKALYELDEVGLRSRIMATNARREFAFHVTAYGNSCDGHPSVQKNMLAVAPVRQTALRDVGLEG